MILQQLALLLSIAPNPLNGPALARLVAAEYVQSALTSNGTTDSRTPKIVERNIQTIIAPNCNNANYHPDAMLERDTRITPVRRNDAPEVHDALTSLWREEGLNLAFIGIVEKKELQNIMFTFSLEGRGALLFIERSALEKLSPEELYALLLHERAHAIADDTAAMRKRNLWVFGTELFKIQLMSIAPYLLILSGVIEYKQEKKHTSLLKIIGGAYLGFLHPLILERLNKRAHICTIEPAADARAQAQLIPEKLPHALGNALSSFMKEIMKKNNEKEARFIAEAQNTKELINREYASLFRDSNLTPFTLNYILNFSPEECIREAFPHIEVYYGLILARIKKLSQESTVAK